MPSVVTMARHRAAPPAYHFPFKELAVVFVSFFASPRLFFLSALLWAVAGGIFFDLLQKALGSQRAVKVGDLYASPFAADHWLVEQKVKPPYFAALPFVLPF